MKPQTRFGFGVVWALFGCAICQTSESSPVFAYSLESRAVQTNRTKFAFVEMATSCGSPTDPRRKVYRTFHEEIWYAVSDSDHAASSHQILRTSYPSDGSSSTNYDLYHDEGTWLGNSYSYTVENGVILDPDPVPLTAWYYPDWSDWLPEYLTQEAGSSSTSTEPTTEVSTNWEWKVSSVMGTGFRGWR